MSGTQRRIDPGVGQELLREPHRFQFFQSVRVLEHMFVRRGVRAQDVVPHKLKFRNSLNMAFPPSEIESLQAFAAEDSAHTGEAEGATTEDSIDEVDIVPAFMGMLGVQGALPTAYTEQIAEREIVHRDRAARRFMDIFNNRAVALFYAAWKKYRLGLQYELDGKEQFLPPVLSLAGLGAPSLRSRMARDDNQLFDQAIAYYSGSIGQRPIAAATMQNILQEYFAVPLQVEQFVGAWYDVPAGQRSSLGNGTAQLGRTAISGDRIWQRNLRLRLWIGPLRHDRFRQFLPYADASRELVRWLNLLGGDSLEYQVCLILHREDVQPCALGAGGGGRLGWDTYLATRASDTHRTGTNYLVHTLH